jgi:hypothetical protein
MGECMKSKNGLPINRGVILIAGPKNNYHPAHWHFHVVNPELGHVLDLNNNIMHMDRDEMESMYVVDHSLTYEEWWENCSQVRGDKIYMSEICAEVFDKRF